MPGMEIMHLRIAPRATSPNIRGSTRVLCQPDYIRVLYKFPVMGILLLGQATARTYMIGTGASHIYASASSSLLMFLPPQDQKRKEIKEERNK